MCNFCDLTEPEGYKEILNQDIYINNLQFASLSVGAYTDEDGFEKYQFALEESATGDNVAYIDLFAKFCPMCGRKLGGNTYE